MIMAVLPGIQSTADRETAMKHSAARLSIFVAVFLIALKTSSGWLTGSLSVWASLLDSVLDLFASTLNFIAVRAWRATSLRVYRGSMTCERADRVLKGSLTYIWKSIGTSGS